MHSPCILSSICGATRPAVLRVVFSLPVSYILLGAFRSVLFAPFSLDISLPPENHRKSTENRKTENYTSMQNIRDLWSREEYGTRRSRQGFSEYVPSLLYLFMRSSIFHHFFSLFIRVLYFLSFIFMHTRTQVDLVKSFPTSVHSNEYLIAKIGVLQ